MNAHVRTYPAYLNGMHAKAPASLLEVHRLGLTNVRKHAEEARSRGLSLLVKKSTNAKRNTSAKPCSILSVFLRAQVHTRSRTCAGVHTEGQVGASGILVMAY